MHHITSYAEDAICKSRYYRQTTHYAQVKSIFNFNLKGKWMASSGVTKIRKILCIKNCCFDQTKVS